METSAQTAMDSKIAEAYAEASKAGADMRAAANSLETIRECLAAGAPAVTALIRFDEQAGQAEPERLAPVLVKLRNLFEDTVFAREISRLKLIWDKNPSKAWGVWLQGYADCFAERGWFTRLGWRMAEEALPSSPVPEWSVQRIRECAELVFHEQWADTYDWF